MLNHFRKKFNEHVSKHGLTGLGDLKTSMFAEVDPSNLNKSLLQHEQKRGEVETIEALKALLSGLKNPNPLPEKSAALTTQLLASLQAIQDGNFTGRSRRYIKSIYKKVFEDLNKKDIENIFLNIADTDLYDGFIKECRYVDGFIPNSFKSAILKHADKFDQICDEVEREEEAASDKDIVQENDTITVIEVDALLPDGDAAKIEGVAFGDPTHDDDVQLRTQPRLSWIIDGLRENGFDLKDMVLYREKKVDGFNPRVSQYKVLEVQKDDYHFQIAVSEVIGNSTLIIKNPIDFSDADDVVITVSDLKKDDAVFQVNCYTQAQWLKSIRHYAFTQLEDLEKQLKTKIYWGNQADNVRQSFGEFYLETEQLPASKDYSVLQHGPLTGKTSFARIYMALIKGSVAGLEHVRNFAQLRDEVFGKGCESSPKVNPLVVQENPIVSFDAVQVFNDAVLSISATGNLPNLGEEFDKSLQAKKVSGLNTLVTDANNISSSKNFLIATGLAQETSDGVITPASPAVIAQFARFIRV